MKSISEGIRERRSIRRYQQDAPVAQDDLKRMLEAGMVAPSAGNSQQREFYVVENRDAIEALSKVHRYAGFLREAPLCIVVCGVPDGESTGMAPYWPQDCAAAVQNILLQAYALGYGACWCGIYPLEERMRVVGGILRAQSVPFAIVSVGVPAEAPAARSGYAPEKVHFLR